MTCIYVAKSPHGYQFCSRREGGNVVVIDERTARMIRTMIAENWAGIRDAMADGERFPFMADAARETIIPAGREEA